MWWAWEPLGAACGQEGVHHCPWARQLQRPQHHQHHQHCLRLLQRRLLLLWLRHPVAEASAAAAASLPGAAAAVASAGRRQGQVCCCWYCCLFGHHHRWLLPPLLQLLFAVLPALPAVLPPPAAAALPESWLPVVLGQEAAATCLLLVWCLQTEWQSGLHSRHTAFLGQQHRTWRDTRVNISGVYVYGCVCLSYTVRHASELGD